MAVIPQHMPRRRTGHTTSVAIGGERFYLTANAREDGSLGEVFIAWGKQGQTCAGLMDVYAVALSIGLQHGVPLAELLAPGLGMYFVPNGHTDDPDIPRVRSVVDWVCRRLAIDWLPAVDRVRLEVFTVGERVDRASAWLASQDAAFASSGELAVQQFRADLASGIGAPATPAR